MQPLVADCRYPKATEPMKPKPQRIAPAVPVAAKPEIAASPVVAPVWTADLAAHLEPIVETVRGHAPVAGHAPAESNAHAEGYVPAWRRLARDVAGPVEPTRSTDARPATPAASVLRPAAPPAHPRDPAPSRMAYRMHRLWLTPIFRALMRVGVPAFFIVLGLGLWLSDPARRESLVERVVEVKREVQERPEFMVSLLAIDGATPSVSEAIRAIMPVNLPVSSFDLDLEALRRAITAIDAVADAEVRVRPGGILQVDVTERVPVAIWRVGDTLELIDAGGHRVATLAQRDARPDLPMLAGEGADIAVAEASAILAAAKPIIGRVRGLVRVGERRWDLVLDREQRILLPESGAVRALERVIALDQAEDMLGRDLTIVDLRNEDRPTIRLSAAALDEMRGITTNGTEVAGQ